MLKVVADENIPLIDAFFGEIGAITRLPGRTMTPDDLEGADVLVVRSVTPVNQALLAKSSIKFVGTCTIGIDHLETEFFDNNAIAWSSAPGCNANSVVEYVYAALAHLNESWLGKRVGIIGAGRVGGTLYQRLKAQNVDVVCYDPNLTLEQNPDLVSLEEVLSCDVISMHTPLVKTGPYPSFHLLGEKELHQLQPNAVLINAGRGPVIDNQALKRVLQRRKDLRVVLDVWEPEPDLDLELLPLVKLATPHIAGYSYDGKLNGTEMVYRACCKALGISPKARLEDLVPPLSDNQLLVDQNTSPWELAKSLIHQVYDIGADDRRLREQAARAQAGDLVFGEAFDGLRKNYPRRREFHNYRLDGQALTSEAKDWLKALGFKVEAE